MMKLLPQHIINTVGCLQFFELWRFGGWLEVPGNAVAVKGLYLAFHGIFHDIQHLLRLRLIHAEK